MNPIGIENRQLIQCVKQTPRPTFAARSIDPESNCKIDAMDISLRFATFPERCIDCRGVASH